MKMIRFGKNDLIIFAILVFITVLLNNLIFNKQLSYGFRDVDWVMLYYYKSLGNLSFNHLIESVRLMGAYTYEIYYVGFLEKLFGLNFAALHLATQIFKIVSAICLYFLVLKIFKRKLLAFLSSLIYTISYTHAGALFMLATGGYFFATIFLILFLYCYYQAIINRDNIIWVLLSSGLLALTLILNTERMYPLILFIPLIEFVYLYIKKWKKDYFHTSFKRLFVVFLPIILFILVYKFFIEKDIVNTGFAPSQFFFSLEMRLNSIAAGNWQLLFYPFASLGSIFLHGEYWRFLGTPDFRSFGSYIQFLTFGPILRIGIITFILLSVLYKRSFKLTVFITVIIFVFGLVFYSTYQSWQAINPLNRIHFDPNISVLPTLWGFYIFVLSVSISVIWLKTRNKDLHPLLFGIFFALLFIFLTWMASDIQLLFMGPQRYLSIPSLGVGIFISGLLVLIFDKLRKFNFTKKIAVNVFLVLIPLVYINQQVANEFFDYEINYAGMKAEDQIKMRADFRKQVSNINKKENSLFYFDETADHANGYFDESTILAGFEFWTKVKPDGSIEYFPDPGMMRTNVQCPEHTHASCIKMLKEGLTVNNGESGVLYKDVIRGQTEPKFYKLSNFYAFRFIDKKLVDIRDEVLEEIKK